MERVRCILPCAGLGTRMNMPADQSKEMLIDPVTMSPIIDYSLNLCKKYDLDPVIITRHVKKDLINYLTEQWPDAKQMVLPDKLEGEWASTVLKSEPLWGDHNILMLPDTRFKPDSCIENMKQFLKTTSIVLATHKVEITIPWGIVIRPGRESGLVVEKPTEFREAWGLVGFHREEGIKFFDVMKTKNEYYSFNSNPKFVTLDSFFDITRTGKLEKY